MTGLIPPEAGAGTEGRALWAALGGTRGVIESILPGLAFLILFGTTKDTFWSVVPSAVLAAAFLIVRIVQRQRLVSAVTGLVFVAVSAATALFTGEATDNFLPGLWINAGMLVLVAITLLVRWPIAGLLVGALTGDLTGWREEPLLRKGATTATWVLAGLFAARLAVELPLYFSRAAEGLALAKLLMGVPLYAAVLWLCWLLLRPGLAARRGSEESSAEGPDPVDEV